MIARNQGDNGNPKKSYESHSDSSDHESNHPIVSSYPAIHDNKLSTTPRFKRCHSLLYDGVQQQLESSRSFSFLPFEEIESNIVKDQSEEEKNDTHCLSPHSSSDEANWMDDYLINEDVKPPAHEKEINENKRAATASIALNRMLDRATISVDDLRPGLFQDMVNNKRMYIFH